MPKFIPAPEQQKSSGSQGGEARPHYHKAQLRRRTIALADIIDCDRGSHTATGVRCTPCNRSVQVCYRQQLFNAVKLRQRLQATWKV